MTKIILNALLLTGAISGSVLADTGTQAPEESALPPPSPAQKIPDPPRPDVRAYLLMDYTSGRVLLGEHFEERIDPASLTKMMTSYVIGQELKLGRIHADDMVPISENAWGKKLGDSSKMFLEVGKTVPVEMLNKGIIIQSGNDACIAMAEYIAGSESSFASLMNEWGKRIGLKGSNFVNSHGLYNENHYSTAYDMAVLGRALIKDLPEEYQIYSQKEFTFNNIKQVNRNRLLWDNSIHVDGIKTGHISQVGYNLVASAINDKNGMRLISVVIGDVSEKSRAANSLALLRYGLRFYEPYSPLAGGQTLLKKEVRLGDVSEVPLGTLHDVSFAVPLESEKRIKATYVMKESPLRAPIAKGQVMGTLTFSLDGKAIYEIPLVALSDVAEGGFMSRMWDQMYLTVSGWF
ncbi:MAG: D-alanyl-D-alanine carboxypeptidase [Succinimonas sp.]|jgi:D-alanyl-D-alanine carboxypeptidase (penicillin-binding protein 5/6)|nr:D-alanyl-D-alanine carboxypeptidase [Succinimonas sp.]MEE3421150.1 serine hydrolase [Succinimonas sp.]